MRRKMETKSAEISSLESRVKNIPNMTKLQFETRHVKVPSNGAEIEELRSEIDRQADLIRSYRSDLGKQNKEAESAIRLAKWNEKKTFQAKIKDQV